MEKGATRDVEAIQATIAKILATHPAGHGLRLIGGYRYRLLDQSPRMSADVDYHWDGDLVAKQAEVVRLFRRKLLPEVRARLSYTGTVGPGTGPDAESPSVRTVRTVFTHDDPSRLRIEIPVEITRVCCLDPPAVRTVNGVVFPTVSDTDMIESKVIAMLTRVYIQDRDLVDVFLFHDSLAPDSGSRLAKKLTDMGLRRDAVDRAVSRLTRYPELRARSIDQVLDEQLDATVAANIKAAGGGETVFAAVVGVLENRLGLTGGPEQ